MIKAAAAAAATTTKTAVASRTKKSVSPILISSDAREKGVICVCQ